MFFCLGVLRILENYLFKPASLHHHVIAIVPASSTTAFDREKGANGTLGAIGRFCHDLLECDELLVQPLFSDLPVIGFSAFRQDSDGTHI